MHGNPPAAIREWPLLLTLAGIQFTHILDFMVIMPLGPQLIAAFSISNAQFGVLVSAYTFSAGVSGLLAALYIDRFERRRLLLLLYGLFALATLACGLAYSFESFLIARVAAGFFGGVLSAMSQTIVADTVPYERRGKAMGVVMTAFSVSTVLGVPLSLALAVVSSWHMPFVVLGGLSMLLCVFARFSLPVLNAHLNAQQGQGWLTALVRVLRQGPVWNGFAFSFCMVLASFVIIPYITLYLQTNAGLKPEHIPLVYLCGGVATLISAPSIGRLADRWGKHLTYRRVAFVACVPMLLMGFTASFALPLILVVTTLFFVFVSGRMIPGMAMLTQSITPADRGTFMTLNASVQSAAMGVAALLGGFILGRDADGLITHYWVCSLLGVVLNLLAVGLAGRLKSG